MNIINDLSELYNELKISTGTYADYHWPIADKIKEIIEKYGYTINGE